MLKIEVKISNDKFKEVIFEGHSMYDEFGKDIVCAAASSILTTSVNSILTLKEDALEVIYEKDKVTVKVISEDDNTYKLMDCMVSLLEELERNYPKNIEVK